MKNNSLHRRTAPLWALCAAALLAPVAARADLVMHPKQVGASLDLGMVKSGYAQQDLERFPLTRTGVYLTASGTYDEHLDIIVTTGGLFWFAAPDRSDVVTRTMKFGPGVGQAQAIYSFGNPEAPSSRLQFGLFPVKYTDSHNLGEYLYRSGTYPGYEVTGGWSYLNSSSYLAQGVRYTLPTFGGKVIHDFTAFMERDWEPVNDISPGYNLTIKPNNFLEFGAGVVWSHGIPLKGESVLTPKREFNAYSKTTGMPVHGAGPYGIRDSVVFNIPNDPSSGVAAILSDTTEREGQTLRDWAACEAGDCSNIGYYTFRGFKGAVRASVDIGTLLNPEKIRAGDFKVYTEVALLGFKDYPFYYDDKLQRMPVMVGINIPTLGILDRLSTEVEYRKSRNRNTIYGLNREQIPVPITIASGEFPDGYAYIGTKNTDDDWRWSVYATRRITDGISLTGQIASDHMRHPDFWGVASDEPVTALTKDWYFVVRLDFGLF